MHKISLFSTIIPIETNFAHTQWTNDSFTDTTVYEISNNIKYIQWVNNIHCLLTVYRKGISVTALNLPDIVMLITCSYCCLVVSLVIHTNLKC